MRGLLEPLAEQRVLRALRIPHIHQIDEISERGVREAVLKAMGRALALRAWSAVFESFELRAENRSGDHWVIAGSPTLLQGRGLLALLEHCQEVSLMVVTLGEAWDEALDALADANEPAEAWFLDALGTRMVDDAARIVEARIASDMARVGLLKTGRYRPGYGDFKLEAQAEICARLKAERISVRVNEAFALLPRKSVSGVVGWAQRPGADADDGQGEGAD